MVSRVPADEVAEVRVVDNDLFFRNLDYFPPFVLYPCRACRHEPTDGISPS